MTRQERITEAQRFSRVIEKACDGEDLFAWFEGTHITTYPDKPIIDGLPPKLEKAYVVFSDCPWTELEFDAKADKAYVYVGMRAKARVPQRAIYELRRFFNTLHNC